MCRLTKVRHFFNLPLYFQFTNFDGVVHTGVPTRTTPTLTPTTLRNIEQTFIELTRETERAEPHQNEAGFVPPLVQLVPQGRKKLLIYESACFSGDTISLFNKNRSQTNGIFFLNLFFLHFDPFSLPVTHIGMSLTLLTTIKHLFIGSNSESGGM